MGVLDEEPSRRGVRAEGGSERDEKDEEDFERRHRRSAREGSERGVLATQISGRIGRLETI